MTKRKEIKLEFNDIHSDKDRCLFFEGQEQGQSLMTRTDAFSKKTYGKLAEALLFLLTTAIADTTEMVLLSLLNDVKALQILHPPLSLMSMRFCAFACASFVNRVCSVDHRPPPIH